MRFRKTDLSALRRKIDEIRGPLRKEPHPILGLYPTWAALAIACAKADNDSPTAGHL